MCYNCAFSVDDRPNECLECDICIRNPKNATVKFQPTMYKTVKIEKPIDMYISKEFMKILREELRRSYEEALKHIPNTTYIPPWNTRINWTYDTGNTNENSIG